MVMDVKRYFFTEDQKAVEKSFSAPEFLKFLFWLPLDKLEFLFAMMNVLYN